MIFDKSVDSLTEGEGQVSVDEVKATNLRNLEALRSNINTVKRWLYGLIEDYNLDAIGDFLDGKLPNPIQDEVFQRSDIHQAVIQLIFELENLSNESKDVENGMPFCSYVFRFDNLARECRKREDELSKLMPRINTRSCNDLKGYEEYPEDEEVED